MRDVFLSTNIARKFVMYAKRFRLMKPVDPLNVEPIGVGKYIWTTIVF